MRLTSKNPFLIAGLLLVSLITGIAAPTFASSRQAPSIDFAELAVRLQQSSHAGTPRALDEFSMKKPDAVGEAGKTLVVTFLLTGLEATRQVLREAGLTAETASKEELTGAVAHATDLLMNNGELWLGLIGSTAMTGPLDKPIQALGSVLASGAARKTMGTLVASGVLSFADYFGTLMARELWQEAREMITDPADYQRAGRLLDTALASVISGKKDSAKKAEDRRVFGILLHNMARILLHDPDLRSAWFYNAWRLRIATGDFVSMVMAMSAAAFAGSLVPTPFPGAGMLIGVMFGAAGGVAAMLVPQEVNDYLTDSIRKTRSGVQQGKLGTNLVELKQVLHNLDRETPLMIDRGFMERGLLEQLAALLRKRREIRQDLITARMELVYSLTSRIHGLRQTLHRLDQSDGTITEIRRDHLESSLHDCLAALGGILQDLGEIYSQEERAVAGVNKSLKALPGEATESLRAEILHLQGFRRLTAALISGLQTTILKDDGESAPREPGALAALQTMYFRGYNEVAILQAFSR